VPFHALDDEHAAALVAQIDAALAAGQFDAAIAAASTLIQLSLEGSHYFQTYDWLLLRSTVSAGYLGWIVFSITFMVKQ